MADVKFKWDATELNARLLSLPERLNHRVKDVIDIAARRGETEMKDKAPWTDRSGGARAGLFTQVVTDGGGAGAGSYSGALTGVGKYSIVFAHTVDYGIYLETMQSGKWEIIMPTVKSIGDLLMYSFQGLFNELDAPATFVDYDPEPYERGTSQGPTVAAERGARTYKREMIRNKAGTLYARYRDIRTGRFISARAALLRRR